MPRSSFRGLKRAPAQQCDHSYTIETVLSLITEHFDDLQTINLLARTNKALSAAVASDPALFSNVVANMPAMPLFVLRRLFVLQQRTSIPVMTHKNTENKAVLATFTERARYNPLHAFEIAMRIHKDVPTMAKVFHRREIRSKGMAEYWRVKREAEQAESRARHLEIRTIKEELQITHGHMMAYDHASMEYYAYGRISPLSEVYRDKMLMMYKESGRSGGAQATRFLQIARKDMATPRTMTHEEDLFILKHTIAWNHYLNNFSNYRNLVGSISEFVIDCKRIAFLIPLPDEWPWLNNGTRYIAGGFNIDDLEGMWGRWRALHDTLHPGILGVLVLD